MTFSPRQMTGGPQSTPHLTGGCPDFRGFFWNSCGSSEALAQQVATSSWCWVDIPGQTDLDRLSGELTATPHKKSWCPCGNQDSQAAAASRSSSID